jgi:hypothetical protein
VDLVNRFWQLCKVLVIHLVIFICFFLEGGSYIFALCWSRLC